MAEPEEDDDDTLESADVLNERARLYPWMFFRQNQLQRMTSLPRQAVSAAFDAADFPAQFGRSRPEDLFRWVREQDMKIQTKAIPAKGKK